MKTALILFLAAAFSGSGQTRPVPVIFDTDIGDDIDDALALALALQSPELDLRLVTTVADDVESRTRLAWKELGIFRRRDIPLATGAPEPLLDPTRPDHAAQFGVLTPADRPPNTAFRRAPDAIIETLMASDRKITVIPVGPLTNIAIALREEPRIRNKIERIVLMGGAYFPARREYNIYRDRIAAEIVFNSGLPITAVGLDVTEKCKLEGADFEKIRDSKSPGAQFLFSLIQLWQRENKNRFPTLHDPLAVATAIRESLIEAQTGTVNVEIAVPPAYGTTRFTLDDKAATRVAKDVNVRAFMDLFVERISGPVRSP